MFTTISSLVLSVSSDVDENIFRIQSDFTVLELIIGGIDRTRSLAS